MLHIQNRLRNTQPVKFSLWIPLIPPLENADTQQEEKGGRREIDDEEERQTDREREKESQGLRRASLKLLERTAFM